MLSIREIEEKYPNSSHLLYARGYLVSESKSVLPREWHTVRFGGYYVSTHPLLQVSQVSHSGVSLLCLGTIFFPEMESLSGNDVLTYLAEGLAESEHIFFERISATNGRYVLAYASDDGECCLLTDATGMRSAFYSTESELLISSHAHLVQQNKSVRTPKDTRQYKFGFPGNLTPFQGTKILTPNTKLNLKCRRVERFWPRYGIEEIEESECAERIHDLLFRSYRWINRHFDCFVSITAGLDSRVTLAVSGGLARYMTYSRGQDKPAEEQDRLAAETMARDLNLNHVSITRSDLEAAPEEFLKVNEFNTYYRHIPPAPWAYRRLALSATKEPVHIRSNLSEIGRMFYKGRKIDPKSPHDLVRLWSNDPSLHTKENENAFRTFCEDTAFFRCPVELTSLFYWEHRMGCWHSQVALEADIACESLSLYNSRDLLSLFWAVPIEAQKNDQLLKRIVREIAPELAHYPINGKPFG
ncbi:hypothetical protein [Rhodophyticola porphyridii]|nr:hypothetical protein [Rhodophyticola porphyridii]